jgi:hypothetical protein
MRLTWRSAVAVATAALCVGLGLTALWLIATVPAPSENAPQLGRVLVVVPWSLGFGLIGMLILTRRSENRIGWAAFGLAISIATTSILTDLSTAFGRGTVGLTLDLLVGISWLVWLSVFCWFLLLFPNGHLPSRRWRPFGRVLAAWPPLYLIAVMLAPQTVTGPNRYVTIGGAVGEFLNLAFNVLNVLVVLLLVGALVAAIARFRHARGGERQQLKWLAYWAAITVAAVVLSVVVRNPAIVLVSNLAFLGLPITVAIAIFRYRLYDIDVLIKRTLVYGATTAAIGATFFLGIVALQPALRSLTSGSELAVAGSTLVSFGLFQPIRRRVQGAVDHRFDRARYDATRTVDAFADQLRDEVNLDELRADFLGVVELTMAPAHESLWLRERSR